MYRYSIHQDCLADRIVFSDKSDRTGQYKIRVNDKTLYVLNDGTMVEVIMKVGDLVKVCHWVNAGEKAIITKKHNMDDLFRAINYMNTVGDIP